MIDIVISNGTPYIWNPQDWQKLRTEYRILGRFDGASSTNTHNTNRTLPVRLSTVETQFLLKLGVARTVEIPKLYLQKGLVPKQRFLKRRSEDKAEQLSLFKERKRLELEAMVDKIIEGKRRKGRTLIPDRNAVVHDELEKINTTPYEMIKIDFHDPWINRSKDSVPYNFPLPVSELDELRLRVFEDLSDKHKYFLTAGTTFGGDFLAYPGDPVQYHSEFIIICKPSNQTIPKISLISEQRLANTVKKTLLVASIDQDTKQLKYERIIGSHSTVSTSNNID